MDVEAVKSVFPYGQLLPVEFQVGGMRASSGIELPEMGGRRVLRGEEGGGAGHFVVGWAPRTNA